MRNRGPGKWREWRWGATVGPASVMLGVRVLEFRSSCSGFSGSGLKVSAS